MIDIRPDEVQALIDTFDASAWNEMRIATDGFELRLAKDPSVRERAKLVAQPTAIARVDSITAEPRPPMSESSASKEKAKPLAVPDGPPTGHVYLRAANLGTFYKAPKPGASPYVEVGQAVEADTEVCVIEVMKLFTPMYAGVRGIVREVLVQDTELVEFEQPLFLLEVTD